MLRKTDMYVTFLFDIYHLTPFFDIIIQHYLYYVNHFDPPPTKFFIVYTVIRTLGLQSCEL